MQWQPSREVGVAISVTRLRFRLRVRSAIRIVTRTKEHERVGVTSSGVLAFRSSEACISSCASPPFTGAPCARESRSLCTCSTSTQERRSFHALLQCTCLDKPKALRPFLLHHQVAYASDYGIIAPGAFLVDDATVGGMTIICSRVASGSVWCIAGAFQKICICKLHSLV